MAAYREAEVTLANQDGLAAVARADVERASSDLDNMKSTAVKLEALWLSAKLDVERTKIISPIERVFGVILLGAETVQSVQGINNNNGIGGGF